MKVLLAFVFPTCLMGFIAWSYFQQEKSHREKMAYLEKMHELQVEKDKMGNELQLMRSKNLDLSQKVKSSEQENQRLSVENKVQKTEVPIVVKAMPVETKELPPKVMVSDLALEKELAEMSERVKELERTLKIFQLKESNLEKESDRLKSNLYRHKRMVLTQSEDPLDNSLPTYSPLHDFVLQGNLDWLHHGLFLKIPFREKDEKGRGVIHLAAALGRTEMLDIFYKETINLNEQDHEGKSPLHLAVEYQSNALDWLLSKNTNTQLKDKKGWLAFHIAAKVGHVKALEKLYQIHSKVDIVDAEGRTPLMLALAYQKSESVEWLLKKGADVHFKDKVGQMALHYAARFSENAMLQKIIRLAAGVDNPDEHGRTPLHYAASLGRLEAVEALLFHGAVGIVKDNGSASPIHLATLGDHRDVVKRFLEHGVHVDELDMAGRTPLHLAVVLGNVDMVELLLLWGGNTEMLDGVGRTPKQWAKLLNRQSIYERLANL